MSNGKVVQVIGAVVDVEFPRDSIPKIYDALRIESADLTLEVQQQLGDGVVRTIAMGASEGLKRGLMASNTGKPISVPVGLKTLGRITVWQSFRFAQLALWDEKGGRLVTFKEARAVA